MRSLRGLFPRLIDLEHLDRAAGATIRGKRHRPDVAWFLFRREEVLARLQHELAEGLWQPEGFELLTIRDPKPRLIARVPIAERVVHTALVSLMEPYFLRSLSPAAFACRPGYGTHRAVLKLQEHLRRHRFALHLDIRAYFPSIDLGILKALLARCIRDRRFLAILDTVLDAGSTVYRLAESRAWARLADDWPPPGRGLPIGAYASQLFAAHVYLAAFDHWVKRDLCLPGYLRYVDDLFFFADRRSELNRARSEIGAWLEQHRHLRLKHPQARILSSRGHLDALGYRIRRDSLTALPRALDRMRRRAQAELYRPRRRAPAVDLERSFASTASIVLF